MKTTDLPLFHQLLTQPGDQRWERPYTSAAMARLDGALKQWTEAQAAGEIENARFLESKEVISRAVEDAWKRVVRNKKWVDALPDPQRNALDTLPSPNLANMDGRLKRVLKTPPHPTRDNLEALLIEIQPITEAYAFLKANAKKRVVKTAEEVEATRFVPPTSTSKAVAQVKILLETVVDRAFTEVLDTLEKHNRNLIKIFLIAQDKAKTAASLQPLVRYHGYSPSDHFTSKEDNGRGRVNNPQEILFLTKVLNYQYDDNHRVAGYIADATTWKKSNAAALKTAEDIRRHFIFKNLQKLTPILEGKGEAAFKSAVETDDSVSFNRLEGRFHFTFNDGASFNVQNSMVFVVNQFNTRFMRYPLTFHDVVLPNGEAMKLPSEKSMNEVFTKATSDQPTDFSNKARRRRAP